VKKLISIVFPVYNESDNIEPLYRAICQTFDSIRKDYRIELIFVNDGSKDNSFDLLTKLANKTPGMVIINLSRNFGHQIALTAGLDFAAGDAVITMDSDLQDPLEVCKQLINKWQAGYDVVYAMHRKRKGESFFKRISANWFYKIINHLADIDIPQNVGDFRLLDRNVVDELKKFGEHQRFLRGLVSYAGFNQTSITFDRDSRQRGETKYSLAKMWRLALDGITGFSTAPIHFISWLGYVMSGASLAGLLYIIWNKLFEHSQAIHGWAIVAVSVFFIGGVQLIMLGLIGNYVARTYTETQNRPLYIVASIHGKKSDTKSTDTGRSSSLRTSPQ